LILLGVFFACSSWNAFDQSQTNSKPKPEYAEGLEARKSFEETMKALFRAPKPVSKKPRKGKD